MYNDKRYKNSIYNLAFIGEPTESDSNKVARCHRLVNEMKLKIDDMKYSLKLYELDRVSTIRSSVNYIDIVGYGNLFIEKSKKWLEMSKGKIDKRKKYEEKEYYDTLTEKISTSLFSGRDIEITQFMSGGYEHYYDSIILNCEDMVFEVIIPVLEKLDIDNFKYAYEGCACVLVKEGSCSWLTIAQDYDEEKISKKVNEFFIKDELIKQIKEKVKTA